MTTLVMTSVRCSNRTHKSRLLSYQCYAMLSFSFRSSPRWTSYVLFRLRAQLPHQKPPVYLFYVSN